MRASRYMIEGWWWCAAQFTELQQKEQLAKLAMARNALATAPATKKFRFISAVNDQVGAVLQGSQSLMPLQ
jgi:hypothetical protein